MPRGRTNIDFECEFDVVIGKPAKYVPIASAADYIFGYTVHIDVSDRGGRGDRKMGGSDWLIGKNHDTFGPLGPFIVPKEFVKDPMNIRHTFTLNGQVMQDSNTSRMSHNIYELLSYASNILTLNPGDVISGGSPAGTNIERAEPRWMRAGDTAKCAIEGIGDAEQPRRGGIERRRTSSPDIKRRPSNATASSPTRGDFVLGVRGRGANGNSADRVSDCCVLVRVLLPAAAWAQTSIAGVVRDTSGAVLPGVTVEAASPALIEKVRVGRDRRAGRVSDRRSAARPLHRHLHAARLQHLQAHGHRAARGIHGDRGRRAAVGDARRNDYGIGRGAAGRHAQRPRADAVSTPRRCSRCPATGRLSTLISVLPGAVLNNEGDRASGNAERSVADAVRDSRRAERAAGDRRHEHRDGGVEHRRLRLELASTSRRSSPRRAASAPTAIPAACS